MNLIRGAIRHLFEKLKKFSGGYIVPLSRGGPVPTWGEGEGLRVRSDRPLLFRLEKHKQEYKISFLSSMLLVNCFF